VGFRVLRAAPDEPGAGRFLSRAVMGSQDARGAPSRTKSQTVEHQSSAAWPWESRGRSPAANGHRIDARWVRSIRGFGVSQRSKPLVCWAAPGMSSPWRCSSPDRDGCAGGRCTCSGKSRCGSSSQNTPQNQSCYGGCCASEGSVTRSLVLTAEGPWCAVSKRAIPSNPRG
jgi:hypothetical protein